MIAIAGLVRGKRSLPAWHAGFEAMMPLIERHAKVAFRYLDAEAREEAIQETVCNACRAYARLAELDKVDVAYPSVLARFGVAQTKAGRRTGGRLNCHDVLSEYCQRKKRLLVERLDQFDVDEKGWAEILIEDQHSGPAEIAATRIDFSTWLGGLPRRLRKIAAVLATNETTGAAAQRFGVSPGRISQIRRRLHQEWLRFREEPQPVGVI